MNFVAKSSKKWYNQLVRKRVIDMNDIMLLDRYFESNYSENKDNKKNNFFISFILSIYFKRKFKLMIKKCNIDDIFEQKIDIRNGKKVIKNTRLTPEDIFNSYEIHAMNNLELNEIIEKIILDYPSLNKKQVAGALVYCFSKEPLKIIR